ncbi:hypothetical protein [Tumebacillus permanentifrigoris]|uniref:Uncharacterized protein n=1 Tax=Tumebacillus permanentifrigoris TaxID=378543 RepID=A0A316D947_9BACL|nr:hypothetical protein [Tumebacillus permanentifrigoris]PWK13147.1 hypothetical protein C7459_108167 [Tumebacillus permanentifrigoris]
MVDSVQGAAPIHNWKVKYVQHDFYTHSQLRNGTQVVRHEKVERIVTASPATEKSHAVRGQQIDIYA